jgi:hypothetical protein
MATDTQKYANHIGRETRHSAFEEFSRDERRPAVLLLSALVIAAIFFGMGLLVGRWTAEPNKQAGAAAPTGATSQASSSPAARPGAQPPTAPNAGPAAAASPDRPAAAASPDPARRFTLLVTSYDTAEKAQPLIKALQDAGFADVRTAATQAGSSPARYSVLAGRFTEDEARQASLRMRALKDPRVKNVRVIEEGR